MLIETNEKTLFYRGSYPITIQLRKSFLMGLTQKQSVRPMPIFSFSPHILLSNQLNVGKKKEIVSLT
jgi:hypothetical protein